MLNLLSSSLALLWNEDLSIKKIYRRRNKKFICNLMDYINFHQKMQDLMVGTVWLYPTAAGTGLVAYPAVV